MSMYLTSKINPVGPLSEGECGEADCMGKCTGLCWGYCSSDGVRQAAPIPGLGLTIL